MWGQLVLPVPGRSWFQFAMDRFIGSCLEQLLPSIFSRRFYSADGWTGTRLDLEFQRGLVSNEINLHWQLLFQIGYRDMVLSIAELFDVTDAEVLSRVAHENGSELEDRRVVFAILVGFVQFLIRLEDPHLPGFRLAYFRQMVRLAVGPGLWFLCDQLAYGERSFSLSTFPGCEEPVSLVDLADVHANEEEYTGKMGE